MISIHSGGLFPIENILKYRVGYFIRSFKILLMFVILFPFHPSVTDFLTFMDFLAKVFKN